MEISEHTVIVTGGSRGLGRALTIALAGSGANVIIDGRDDSAVQAAVAATRGLPGTVVGLAGDVTNASHRADLVAAAQRLGGPTAIVNNASLLGPSPQPRLAEYDVDTLRAVYDVNVFAPLALVQLALAALRRVGGVVIDVSSDAAVEGYAGWGGYGSSKAALDQLTNVLTAEEPGLRVYAFDPGDMRTAMHQAAFPGEDISDRPEPESVVPAVLRLLDGTHPSGRYRATDLTTEVVRR